MWTPRRALAREVRSFFASATDTRVRGFNVMIRSDTTALFEAGTTATLKAGLTLGIESGVLMDIKSSQINATATGPMILKGSVIQLN